MYQECDAGHYWGASVAHTQPDPRSPDLSVQNVIKSQFVEELIVLAQIAFYSGKHFSCNHYMK